MRAFLKESDLLYGDNATLLVIIHDDLYIFWGFETKHIYMIVDHLKIIEGINKKVLYKSTLYPNRAIGYNGTGTDCLPGDQARANQWINQLSQLKEVSLTQYLTHPNIVLRELIKELIKI